ncbi:MAG: GNAT family N-acetyltransferase [Clostridiales bacterium]|jgi:probable phosphoglycerate mutase|nr:GNAT family N-acetyltransferase [Clostridiales bacterium]
MTEIYIIRHAEAEGNLYRRIHGHYDSLITDKGARQITALQERFDPIPVEAVYSSDLNRAIRTAAAIYKPKNLPLIISKLLREIAMGSWEDLCWGEVEEKYPEQLYYYNTSPDKWEIDGGERFSDLKNRIVSAIFEIAKINDGKTVAVVTHGGAIRALLSYILNVPPGEISRVQYCDNTAVTLLTIENGIMSLKYMNDDSHLSDALSSFRKETWWKEEDARDSRNMRFVPMNLKSDGKTYLACYKDAWQEAHGTHAGFTNIYLVWAKSRSASDPHSVARAYLQNKPCGIIELAKESVTDDQSGHIAFLYLDPPYRGKGLAVQLIGYAVWYYRRLGRTKLRLKVSADNLKARSLYKKYGFFEVGTETGALGTIIIMEKDIAKQ